MSIRFTRALRADLAPLLNHLLAAAACSLPLALAAGPAQASPGNLERVEVQGRLVEAPVNYDVSATCAGIERQLQQALQTAWLHERQGGKVLVQFVMQDGDIDGVKASGMSNYLQRAVRKAVNELQCGPQTQAGARIYRFRVDFADPYETPSFRPDTITASARPALRLAQAKD